MTHRELDAAAAYALGILDEAERQEFETHLSDCPGCRAEVESYRETVAALAHAAPVSSPPDPSRLRERILREARQVRPIAPTHARTTRPNRMPWMLAAASLLLAFAASAAYLAERRNTAAFSSELAALRAEVAARDSTLASFLGPEVHVVSLAAGNAKPAARVFWNHTRNIFIVTAHALPPAPAGRIYQLWAIVEGKPPVSMGTFNTDAAGKATLVLPVAEGITKAGFIDLCGLTVEPEGGSVKPSEQPRLSGAWRHVD
jgi:anti-sigma-K factor RskA